MPGEKRARDSAKQKKLFAVVTDVYGNPVPEARVNFSTKSGTVIPTRAVSDARGRAALTWKLGSKQGEQTLIGVVRGFDVKGEYVTLVGGREPVAKPAPVKAVTGREAAAKPVAPKLASSRQSVAKTASLKSATK
jgi:hypothetical protein